MQLGYSSIQVTVEIYGHFIPGSNREAVNRLAAMRGASVGTEGEAQETGPARLELARN